MRLNGREDIKLTALKLNGQPVPDNAYDLTDDSLTILKPPEEPFEVRARQHRQSRTALCSPCCVLRHIPTLMSGVAMPLTLPAEIMQQVEVTTEIQPEKNTLLEGLYISDGNYCTQCELSVVLSYSLDITRP